MWKNNCLSITLNSVTDEKENGTLVLRINFIVIPANEWKIEEQDVYFFVVADEPIYAVKDRSTEESGFNVFDTVISAECVCVFVFQMPISLFYGENKTETDMNRGVGVYFSPALFHFELELY